MRGLPFREKPFPGDRKGDGRVTRAVVEPEGLVDPIGRAPVLGPAARHVR